jgi:hypothetical protein
VGDVGVVDVPPPKGDDPELDGEEPNGEDPGLEGEEPKGDDPVEPPGPIPEEGTPPRRAAFAFICSIRGS